MEFEAFFLGHQEAFHAYAELHFGTRAAAEEVIHEVFLEIYGGWTELLRAGNLEQGAWAIVRRAVHDRLEREGRAPAFVINGPIAQALAATRDKLQKMESARGLCEAIAELPNRQFEAIVLRYILGYPTAKVAWYVGIDERTFRRAQHPVCPKAKDANAAVRLFSARGWMPRSFAYGARPKRGPARLTHATCESSW
ncbi:sigma-70 family RNA polymerase sigma factor [Streptomyces sp. PSKA54]|uniref:Sigma-70 family RNA polymerase sigma factor n=1 Tax=Streptomyces himalayensis subsp. aureolus TaxID=2758039 RepID=A0A7W2D306_9ACTN|nr:sigma-70 family RNA polymerase sigma factor [Streptomyces himalayensis]MBA4863796.1 sigma-70 family RNA polymerase sigma factor [Streptomyces himalayensis subsp. aureolus]